MEISEIDIYLKMDMKNVAFLKGILEATDGLAFMRVEDGLVRIITTNSQIERTRKLIDSMKRLFDFQYINDFR